MDDEVNITLCTATIVVRKSPHSLSLVLVVLHLRFIIKTMLVLVQSHQSLTFLSYQLLCGHIACGNISISTWPYAQKHKHNHLFKVCKQNHHLFNCKNFKSMKPQARLGVVKSNKICFLCLFPGYCVSVCKKAYRSLPSCGKKHS